MLNKILIICSLTICTFGGLQAECRQCHQKKGAKDLSPGALVCNGSENRCIKEEGKKEITSSSSLFTVFCDDAQDEENLIACKDCQ